jgi:hypothetical protein
MSKRTHHILTFLIIFSATLGMSLKPPSLKVFFFKTFVLTNFLNAQQKPKASLRDVKQNSS